jgi:hypothetical protein
MRDEQVRRYARHLMLPDVGGLGQTALMVATARLPLREAEPLAELTAGAYLAAGGVGTLVVTNASQAQLDDLAAHGADTKVVEGSRDAATKDGMELALSPRPTWWPAADGDATALAFWRGSIAAIAYMAEVVSR